MAKDSEAMLSAAVADYLRALELRPRKRPLQFGVSAGRTLVSVLFKSRFENFNWPSTSNLRMLMPSAVAAWRSPVLTSTKEAVRRCRAVA